MGTLYKLTTREADILSNQDQSDIIATGPWCKGNMTLPHRAVIRDHGDTFVVHTQIVGDSHAYYEHGVYIPLSIYEGAFEKALVAFDRKIRLHHNINVFTRE